MAILRQASEAKRATSAFEPLPVSPGAFSGSVQEFFDQVIAPTLPLPAQVVGIHRALAVYLREASPLFPVRAVTGTERRSDYRTLEGETFRATDNAPAWWMYGALAAGHRLAPDAIRAVVDSIPCHMFDVASRSAPVPSKRGWHIAHILPVKDRNVDFRRWSRRDLVRRFIRNVHPANYFLLPGADWQRLGNDGTIVGFAAALHRQRYAEIWDEFADWAECDASDLPATDANARVEFGHASADEGGASPPKQRVAVASPAMTHGAPVVSYRATRLLFRRDVIEALGDDERFRVDTPVGSFEMTKGEFYEVFPGVVASKSYREGGNYHFPQPPKRAEAFRRARPG